MSYEVSPNPTAMTGKAYEDFHHPTVMTGKAAQWLGLMMLLEVFALIALLCLR